MLNGNIVSNWKMFPINETVLLHNMNAALKDQSVNGNVLKVHANNSAPALSYFSFSTSHICDTFLKLDAWTKVSLPQYILNFVTYLSSEILGKSSRSHTTHITTLWHARVSLLHYVIQGYHY